MSTRATDDGHLGGMNAPGDERSSKNEAGSKEHVEILNLSVPNLEYDILDEEPALRARTYIALAAMFMMNLVMLVALMGPPTFLTAIGEDFNDQRNVTWVVNALGLVQGVLGPLISSASDLFQARKPLLLGSCVVSFIGSAIAARAGTIYQLVAAQALIGVGFASVPLAYCVPSEIVPRRWRPMTQATMNTAACIGAIVGPVIMGGFLQVDGRSGWRNFFWVQMGLWGFTAFGIFVGYRPPKRHARLDHLSVLQKIKQMDIPGCTLLTIGITLLLTGLNLAGGMYSWTNSRVLVTVIVGAVTLGAFGLYEWRGTQTGIFHHEIFNGPNGTGKTATISICLIGVEGFVASAYYLFYPIQVATLFTTVPMKVVARQEAFWVGCTISGLAFGYVSTRFRIVRELLAAGLLIFTAGLVGLATIQPGHSLNSLIFVTLAGIGFGAVLILVVASVHLCTPHKLIATATAVVTTTRALVGGVATAVFSAAFRTALEQKLPLYVSEAAVSNGLPIESLPTFIAAFLNNDSSALSSIDGIDTTIITASAAAMKQAYADSARIPFIIAAPVSALAILSCYFLSNLQKEMNYRVDAPVEVLQTKHEKQHNSSGTA
ncbi:uncharacterized protein A1O9_07266 [Exophiala aquamarina CBS 119918]|uniref:Major facilitator superfamily (MFS) profile domain-containing protein n=1 Tax=Exophiala aquamarina CBS 119918 TaxID=1182545 RepID=A0A072PB17_9EURO|nr:uncharacterized protein A1O9_07266 [Exophiala aquamarina CBS 119918]KEF57076.1 hypothetical protein A1O9_07266 [Exophiala aquamarina CBS 119918]